MATAGDIREIMDMPQEGPPKPVAKKVRVDPGPRLTGFQREVQSLMSDSHHVPPIPIVDNLRYKAKPTYAPRSFKTRKWEERRFVNGARTDGLELRHWKHVVPAGPGQRLLGLSTNGTNIVRDGIGQDTAHPIAGNEEIVSARAAAPIRYEDEFPMEKFNVQASVPSYTPEQYEAYFKSDDWSKEETDYLMELCRNFDLRWIVVADRYEPHEIPISPEKVAAMRSKQPGTGQANGEAVGDAMDIDQSTAPGSNPTAQNQASSNNTAIAALYSQRTLESLKSRYYTIASKMLSITTPPDTMTPSEFALWEKMKNFDGRTEELRKSLAEKLFLRTKEEADEERTLLEELARITKNEEEFLKLRKDLYQRLETPVLSRRAEDQGTAAHYHSSQGLGLLLSNLMNREKRFKRPGMIDTSRANSTQDANGEAERGTAGTANDRPRKQTWEKGQHPNQYTARRNTMDSESANGDNAPKKTGSMAQTPNVRNLTSADEAKYGVAHPQDRLTSGVQFRHEKASKIVLSKSAAQMAKIQAALVELGIPVRLLMPTERVCREYERLIADIVLLLDTRRGSERVQSEVKVLQESRRIRLGLPKEDKDGGGGDEMDVDKENKAREGAEERQNSADDRENGKADEGGEAEASDDEADVAVEGDEDVAIKGAEQNVENRRRGPNTRAEDTGDDDEADEDSQNEEADDNENKSESEANDEDGNAKGEENDDDEEEEEEEEEEDELTAAPKTKADEEAEEDVEGEQDEDDDEEDEEEEEQQEAAAAASGANNDETNNNSPGHRDVDPDADADDGDNDDDDHQQDRDADREQQQQQQQQPEAKNSPHPASFPSSRLHKRSASVISDGSRAGSNRSGVGRKKGRR
jgi:DNA methyltransferase 1-associated protein 1